MEESGSSRSSSASSAPKCVTCRNILPRGQSGQCTVCCSSQSTPEPSEGLVTQAPLTQTFSGLPSEPVWVGFLCTAVSDISTSTKATVDMLGHMMKTSPSQSALKGKVPAKRPRVDPPTLSPIFPLPTTEEKGAVTPEEPMDLLDSSPSIRDFRSEGECSDQEQEGDPEMSPSMSSMVDELITAVRDTFHIQGDASADSQQEFSFFPSKNLGKGFPICGDLTLSLTKAWNHPEKRFVPPKRLDLLYPFPADAVTKWSTAPKVDPPVARLAKHTTLPVAEGATLRDPADRRVEFFSKNAFEAGGSALRPIFASAWVAKAATEWALRLQRDVVAGVPVADLQTNMSLIIQATKFLCEASFDAGALVAQSTALIVAVRRSLWLKVWAADPASKRSLTNLPFLGNRLFGNRLDELISEATGGKSTLLPQNKPKRPPNRRDSASRFQSFRRPSATRYSAGQGYKPAPAQGKRPSFKPKSNWRGRTQSAQSSSSKQSSA